MKNVYLDHNGSAPVASEVIVAMRPWFESGFGNPSSSHVFGKRGREAIEQARTAVATLIGASSDEVYFTGGGTESNNLILKGIAEARESDAGHIVTTAIEHPSCLSPCRWLERHGFGLTVLGVDGNAKLDLAEFEAALRPDTFLVSVMLANNEVGTIQDLRAISRLTRSRAILLHTDAAQYVGKQPLKVDNLGVDAVTIAGHKLNAPKGVGAVYLRRDIPIVTQAWGAGHERGVRSGTQNTMGIVGLGAAATRYEQNAEAITAEYKSLRDYFETRLVASIEGALVNARSAERLVNTTSIAIPGISSGALLERCPAIAAAPGAACHKDHTQPSHVLAAMKASEPIARSTIRYSVGYGTTREELDFAVDELRRGVESLR